MTEKKIIATKVAEEDRLEFLPAVFGNKFLSAEGLVYRLMGALCDAYNGGYWEFYKLDNGGFFMAPTAEKMDISWAGNYYSGQVSGQAAGIIASLFAINTIANEDGDEKMTNAYYHLLDFACQHPEASDILGAID